MCCCCLVAESSLPGSSVHGVFQARILEWVAISFPREYALPWWLRGKESSCNMGNLGLIHGSGRSLGEGKATHSIILAQKIPWTELQFVGSQRVRYNWETNTFLFLQGIFPSQGSNPCLLHWQADSLPLRHQGSPYARKVLPQRL